MVVSTEVTVFGARGLPKSVEVGGTETHTWSFDEKSSCGDADSGW